MKRTTDDAAGGDQQHKQPQTPPPKQPPKQPATEPPKQSATGKPFRLPDKANFNLTYSAGTESWTGTLTIGEWSKTATASGVHNLLAKLGQTYKKEDASGDALLRFSVQPQPATVSVTDGAISVAAPRCS